MWLAIIPARPDITVAYSGSRLDNPVIALIMECYYFGFSMLDYSFAKGRTYTFKVFVSLVSIKAWQLVMVFFYVMHILIILAPAYAIIAATLSVHKMKMPDRMGTVYLIPSLLSEEGIDGIPPAVLSAVKNCQVFFVENERTTRRYFKKDLERNGD